MKKIKLGTSELKVSNIALGCMRMAGKSIEEAKDIISTSIAAGINFFDHADIYGDGESERIFGQAFKELGIDRSSVFIQSKCGIRKGMFDFSRDHIINAVDGILERLQMTHLDLLVLHRPDTLMEPKEVNEAFEILLAEGKVNHFGVSNQSTGTIELLKTEIKVPLLVNQLQLSLMHAPMINYGFNVNMYNEPSIDRTQGILEYSRIKNMTIQAWSPFYSGYFEDVFMANEKFPEVNAKLNEMAAKYGVSDEAIAVAWILRHPANMQVLIGSMNVERIVRICEGSDINMSREDWYDLYHSAGNLLP
ncbi:aldo/keto reductase family oxidoreductase [Erysipelothrix sp. HDW6C]|uniref:aldo/keto reductase n=1 Tax=Erysipelothrix sp. HDW6C TaxID=2714930 RepID=UPI001408F5F3|nr:aldo/keto reductase [Erysipelothrix sp. HDW6C]QIK68911.1 aldo/keto reductase family oxidoreductase [Erysipelothrix sp. HDW6C]